MQPRKPARIAEVAFGLFLLAVAGVIVFVASGASWWGSLAAGGLGLEAVVSGRRGRPSLVSRNGPVP